MIDKARSVLEEVRKLDEELVKPEYISNIQKLTELNKKRASLMEVAEYAEKYVSAYDSMQEAQNIIDETREEELLEIAREQYEESRNTIESLQEKMKILLVPPDPYDEKNVIIEIRAGAGGDEAGIFAADLMRMYMRYAESNNWLVELIEKNEGQPGSIKETIFIIKGTNVYKWLRFESGVHRVQRVPVTESQGRVHTSTATVAVLPEAENVDIDIKDDELRIDVFRSSGPGGQSVNTTDSAVRITHLPTGLVVTCQDEKSQHKNKAKALNVLKSRLLAAEEEKRQKEEGAIRKSQIGTGDRSEKIRTYNFPQDRVTDHRVKKNWSDINGILDGNIRDIVENIYTEYINSKLTN